MEKEILADADAVARRAAAIIAAEAREAVAARGRFSVAGTFVLEHGGPAVADEVLPVHTARYQGTLDRQKVEFTVTIEGQTGQGPFTVTLAKTPKLEKCV